MVYRRRKAFQTWENTHQLKTTLPDTATDYLSQLQMSASDYIISRIRIELLYGFQNKLKDDADRFDLYGTEQTIKHFEPPLIIPGKRIIVYEDDNRKNISIDDYLFKHLLLCLGAFKTTDELREEANKKWLAPVLNDNGFPDWAIQAITARFFKIYEKQVYERTNTRVQQEVKNKCQEK